ncbi:3'-5' exonuclease [Amycolatopsis samaneae]|uniref:3'-5' exonuclease n=1 Tax=Amycolatopsis samaneae TaxID=664691 RepID=A0ABW5GEX2_9PSEU
MSALFEPLILGRDGRFPARASDFTVLELGVTGLRPGRVVEVGAVRIGRDGAVLSEFSTLVDPGHGVSPGWTAAHRITRAELDGAPGFGDVLGPLLDLCRGSVVVAHDLPLVQAFLEAELARAGVLPTGLPGICVMDAVRRTVRLPNYRLGTVAGALGIDAFPAHLAASRAHVTGRVLTTLIATHGLLLASPPEFPELPRFGARRSPVRRAEAGAPEPGWMANVVERVATGPADDTADRAYLDLLAEAVADEYLSPEEVRALAALAAEAGLSEVDVQRTHTAFVSALRAVAEGDGVVTGAEQRALGQIAEALGVPEVVEGLRLTGAGGRPARVLVIGASADADRLRAAVLAEGVQLAQRLTATVTHVAYDAGARGEESRLARARELGAEVMELTAAPAALGLEPATPSLVATPSPAATPRPAAAPSPAAAPRTPAPQPVPRPSVRPEPVPDGVSRPYRQGLLVGGRCLLAVGLVLMFVTVVALFAGSGFAGGLIVGLIGVGLFLGGWWVAEEGRGAA